MKNKNKNYLKAYTTDESEAIKYYQIFFSKITAITLT